ncbi:MAG: hypothetical protein ACREEV_14060, partial [Dongiaceae bacterium]
AAAVGVTLLTATPVHANDGDLSAAQVATIVLSEVEKRVIGDYYRHQYVVWVEAEAPGKGKNKKKHGHLPPGLAKKGSLPPGLAKQLARNGTLPPGLAKRSLPDDLMGQLAPRPAGYEFILIDDRVMLIQAATNLILDVLVVAAAEAS